MLHDTSHGFEAFFNVGVFLRARYRAISSGIEPGTETIGITERDVPGSLSASPRTRGGAFLDASTLRLRDFLPLDVGRHTALRLWVVLSNHRSSLKSFI